MILQYKPSHHKFSPQVFNSISEGYIFVRCELIRHSLEVLQLKILYIHRSVISSIVEAGKMYEKSEKCSSQIP